MPEGRIPRHEFSMFPDPLEQQKISVASPDDLVGFVMKNPTMMPDFLHELWRTGKTTEIAEIGSRLPQLFFDFEDDSSVPIDGLYDVTAFLLFRLRYQYNIGSDICGQYLAESWTALIGGHDKFRGYSGITDGSSALLKLLTQRLMATVEEQVTQQKRIDSSPLN